MASSPFTLLLLKRPILSSKTRLKPHSFSSSPLFSTIKPKTFSSVSPKPEGIAGHEPLKPTSLSARLNFVFDQIDQIEKRKQQELLENDNTLQRIRAWRQSNKESQPAQRRFQSKEQNPDSGITRNDENPTEFSSSSSLELTESQTDDVLRRIRAWRESKYGGNKECSEGESAENESKVSVFTTDSVTELELCSQKGKGVEFVHPWPEWIELMERLVQQNYFDHKRIDEEKMVEELGFDMSNVVEEVKDDAGIDFKDFKTVQTACLNFGKDRFDILRSLSRQDIQNLVGFGCPSADKKVVFSAKVLRKHVHLDEGDVCSSCSLRNSCEKAYLPTNKEDEARTIDVMRVLLTYDFDYVNGSVVNESVLKQKSLKTVVRKLLYKVVKLSAVPIDPNLPPPVIKKPPPKVKQPPPPKRVGRDDIEMKKGDWLCPKCDFMNFAKNTVCLQCDAKRPKRQLLPGEWECPGCNFLNYRRNMACFHCDCKRPPDAFMESKIQEIRPGSRTRLEKAARRSEVSNGWNFDFDDDESDGADVASFEYADSSLKDEASPLGSQARGGKFRGFEDDFDTGRRASRVHERIYSDIDSSKPGIGFDDFDDEDDIDSYEIDSRQNNPRQKASLNVYSDNELFSDFEDGDGSNDSNVADQRTRFPSYSKPSKHERKKVTLSDSEDELDLDSDEDLSVRPNWKSRHVADTKHGGRGNFRNRGSSGFQGGSFSGSDYENDGPHSKRNEPRRNKLGSIRPGNNVGGRGDYNSRNNSPSRSNTKMNGGRNYSDNFDISYRDSRGNSRRFGEDDYGKQRTNNMQRFKGAKKDGASGNRYRGKSHEYSREMDDPSEFKNSRRVIER